MITAKWNTDGMKRKTKAALLASPLARRAAVGQLLGVVAPLITAEGPKDTNRWVRGWQIASNQAIAASGAGAGSIQVVLPVRASRFAQEQHDRLEMQYFRWMRIREEWVRRVQEWEQYPNHRQWRSWREAMATLNKVGDAEDRAFLALQAFRAQRQGAIVVWGRSSSSGETPMKAWERIRAASGGHADAATSSRVRRQVRLSSLARVFPTAFGGSGRLYDSGDATVAEIRNLEPHAFIVEKRVHAARRAVSRARAVGAGTSARAYKSVMRPRFMLTPAA